MKVSPPWSHTTRLVVILAILAALLALFILALPLFEALTIAGLLALLFDPLLRWMSRRWRLSRAWAVRILFIGGGFLLAGLPAAFGALLYANLSRWADDLRTALLAMVEWLSQPHLVLGFDLSPRLLFEQFSQTAGSAMALVPGGSFNLLSELTQNLLWAAVIVVALFYFLKDSTALKGWLVALAPPGYQDDAVRLLDELIAVWATFLRAQLLILVILGGLLIIGAWIVILLYQLGLIPFSTLGLVVMLVVVYVLVTQVDNIWLKPVLYSQHLRLHLGVVFVAIIAALVLGGFLMALIIVPIIATIKVLANYVRSKLLNQPPWEQSIEESEEGMLVDVSGDGGHSIILPDDLSERPPR